MMALRREQHVEQVEQIAGNRVFEEKKQEASSADPVMQDNEEAPVARARKPPPRPATEEVDKHELTHVVFRSWCKHCVSGGAREDQHRRIATHDGRTPKVMFDVMFFTSDQEQGVQLPVLVVYDLSTGEVMAVQSTKDSSVETVAAVAQTLETWRHTDVVLHADGEPATKSQVRAIAKAGGIALCQSTVRPTVIRARDQSKRAFKFLVESQWLTSRLWRRESAVAFC